MAKGMKKTIAFIFFLLAGVTVGSIVAYFSKDISFLKWLSYAETVGLSTNSPVLVDLSVLKIAFGFTISVSIAQILCIIASILIFSKTCKNL